MIWYVHRDKDGSIASAHSQIQPGYAEEALDAAKDADLIVYFAPPAGPPVTVEEKLARIGLTTVDLKKALA